MSALARQHTRNNARAWRLPQASLRKQKRSRSVRCQNRGRPRRGARPALVGPARSEHGGGAGNERGRGVSAPRALRRRAGVTVHRNTDVPALHAAQARPRDALQGERRSRGMGARAAATPCRGLGGGSSPPTNAMSGCGSCCCFSCICSCAWSAKGCWPLGARGSSAAGAEAAQPIVAASLGAEVRLRTALRRARSAVVRVRAWHLRHGWPAGPAPGDGPSPVAHCRPSLHTCLHST